MLVLGFDIVVMAVYGCVLCLMLRVAGLLTGLDNGERDATTLFSFLTVLFMIVGYAIMVEVFDLMF